MVSTLTTPSTEYLSIPVGGLTSGDPLDFPLYLRTGDRNWVLYREVMAQLDEEHIGRLRAEGIGELFIRRRDRISYARRVEKRLDSILKDRSVELEQRAEVFHGVAMTVAQDLWKRVPGRLEVERATRMVGSFASMLLREDASLAAVRKILGASRDLAAHSLNVSVLSVGLARKVLGNDPTLLARAGLAGLLHDIGRVGEAKHDDGPDHAVRGHQLLQKLGLPPEVCEVALLHHERADGSGFPQGLSGDEIPPLVSVVALVNTFDTIYSKHEPQLGVFDSLRIMAQAYRGCFENDLTASFIQVFRD